MPWKEKTIMCEKQRFIDQAIQNKSTFKSLCNEFGISRTTGYELLKKHRCEGKAGLLPLSKAPHTNPNKTPEEIEERILSIRQKYKWGAKKIYTVLKKENWPQIPVISTISKVLKEHGCISKESSIKNKKLIRFEHEHPNDLWQMDFKGHFQLGTHQSCYPLTIEDDHSRFLICLKACEDETIIPVKKQLILAFKQYGLPKQINVDNGRPWGNSSLIKHTALTVWLLQLDVKVTHSRPNHPQTNGKLERLHRTLKEDILLGKSIKNQLHAQRLFNQWRRIYNYERPHEGINMLVPADRYIAGTREMPSIIKPPEYDNGALLKKVSVRGILHYKGKEYRLGKAFSGYYLELKPNVIDAEIEFYFGKHKIQVSDLG